MRSNRPAHCRVTLDDLADLQRVDEHAAHLCRLIGAAEPAFDPLVGAAARARFGEQRGKITRRKTDQRVLRGQRRDHDLAHLTWRHRPAGPWFDELEDDAFVDHHPLAHGTVGRHRFI